MSTYKISLPFSRSELFKLFILNFLFSSYISIMGVIAHLARRVPAVTAPHGWILAITFIAFVLSGFGNGANDVANSYA